MKTITRFIYVAVAVVIITIGAVATSADRGSRFASINGTGAKGDGSIHRSSPNGVRSIMISGPSKPPVMVPISHTRTLSNVDYVVAGVCGVGGGSGTITIAGVSGTVTHAYLYWHGINNTGAGAEYNNPIVTINGNSVTGTSLGDATTNCWGAGSSRAFEADVTAFVAGNGPYTIAGLSDCLGCNANGASLVVVFDDGNPANNRDLAFFTGNDSNIPEGFPGEDPGWHATLPGIAYAGGMVKAIFHAADGQDFSDNSITFSTGGPSLTILDDATLWDGISVPDAGTSRAPNGGLWDIHTFDITAAFGPPGTTTLQLDGQDPPVDDCLGLVLMLLDLEPGSAPPPTPTPSPSPTPTATATATATATPTPTVTPTTCGSAFVIGDLDAVVGNHVTFWGARWWRRNHLSGGTAPASFKGFANCTNPNPPACGGTWQSDPGNSSHPPDTVPDDMTVIVSSSITKSGSIESGDIPMMVTIHTDPGYEPNPGHEGTGTVTAVICQGARPHQPAQRSRPAPPPR